MKPIDEFRMRSDRRKEGGYKYRNSKCKPCEAEWAREHPQSRSYREEWKARSHASDPMLHYIKERISTWRLNSSRMGVPSDLTTEYVAGLWREQEGRCYYTDVPMIFHKGLKRPMPDSASLDRKDPSLGYVQGNVVWSTYRANTSKGNLTEDQYYAYTEQVLAVRDRRRSKLT